MYVFSRRPSLCYKINIENPNNVHGEKNMTTLAEQIVRLLGHTPGLTDREITDSLRGHSAPQQPINQKCHDLKGRGVLARRTRPDGLIGNYLISQAAVPLPGPKAFLASAPDNDTLRTYAKLSD